MILLFSHKLFDVWRTNHYKNESSMAIRRACVYFVLKNVRVAYKVVLRRHNGHPLHICASSWKRCRVTYHKFSIWRFGISVRYPLYTSKATMLESEISSVSTYAVNHGRSLLVVSILALVPLCIYCSSFDLSSSTSLVNDISLESLHDM